jgi:hypothetical protein
VLPGGRRVVQAGKGGARPRNPLVDELGPRGGVCRRVRDSVLACGGGRGRYRPSALPPSPLPRAPRLAAQARRQAPPPPAPGPPWRPPGPPAPPPTLEHRAVLQLRPQDDALLGADGGQHQRALGDAGHPGEEEHGGLQGTEEEARACGAGWGLRSGWGLGVGVADWGGARWGAGRGRGG